MIMILIRKSTLVRKENGGQSKISFFSSNTTDGAIKLCLGFRFPELQEQNVAQGFNSAFCWKIPRFLIGLPEDKISII